MTNADQRFRIGDNHPGVFQAHHADKQADTAGNTYTQAKRNIGDHPVTYAEDGQQQQTHGAPEDGAHAHLPRQPHRLHHHKGEKGVQAIAGARATGRFANRPIRILPKAAIRQVVTNTALVSMPATPRICGLTKTIYTTIVRNVGETGDGFGAHRGAVLAQLKYALQQTLARRLAGLLLTHYRFPERKEGKFEAILYQITAPGAVVW